ncbi:MAG: helix-turn-helix domain-containing protein [Streptomycetales bacterium]
MSTGAHSQPDWAAAVRRRRRVLGLTQGDLADLAGCTRRTIVVLEGGKASVRLDILLSVLSVLGLRLRVEKGRADGARGGVEVQSGL